jgi:hypothetical protein
MKFLRQSWNDVLFKGLILLAVFDGVRSYMVIIGPQLSFLKEACTFLLLISVLLCGIKPSKDEYLQSNIIFFIYLLTFGTLIAKFTNVNIQRIFSFTKGRDDIPSGYAIHFKTMEAFIVFCLVFFYEKITGKQLKVLIRFFLHCCIAYVGLTLVSFFVVDLSFIFDAHWEGRISIGYPTSDTQVLSFALLILLFEKHLFKSALRYIYIIICAIGIVMQATATGLGSLIVLFAFYGIYKFSSPSGWIQLFQLKTVAVLVVVLLSVLVVNVVLQSRGKDLTAFFKLFELKIDYISNKAINAVSVGQSKDITVASDPEEAMSEEIRKQAFANSFSYRNEVINYIFGGGPALGAIVENQNYFLIRAYGYLGLLLYYGWLVYLAVLAMRYYKVERFGKILLCSIIILVLSNLSTVTTYMFAINAAFSLITIYCLQGINQEKKARIAEYKEEYEKINRYGFDS